MRVKNGVMLHWSEWSTQMKESETEWVPMRNCASKQPTGDTGQPSH